MAATTVNATNRTIGIGGSSVLNYAVKYAKQIDERFSIESVVAPATNNDFKFDGVNAITVFDISTTPLTDYDMAGGMTRFGTPAELPNGVQTLTITKDRSFTFIIDNRSKMVTDGTMDAGAALDRELREECVPEYDRYVLATLNSRAPSANKVSVALTADNAYSTFLQAQNAMGNARVPLANRTAFCSYEFYSYLKQGEFVLESDKGQSIHQTGVVGTVHGAMLVLVPADLLPTNVQVIVIASNLVVAPRPITYYNVHNNPPGVNGWLVEGRMLYDCFVLNNKVNAIYVISKTSGG